MKNILIQFTIVLLMIGSTVPATALPRDNNDKMVAMADMAFDHFSYERALKFYNQAYISEPGQYVAIRIAECHRLLNELEASADWYRKAETRGELPEANRLNYGGVLASMGRYDAAAELFGKYKNQYEWAREKMEGYGNIKEFYRFEDALEIVEADFNTDKSDFAPAIYKDGLAFVSSRSSGGIFSPRYSWDNSNYLDVFEITNNEEKAKPLSNKINTRYHEGPVVFFDDDKKMIFTRNQVGSKNERVPNDDKNPLNLFYSEARGNGKWKKPEPLPFQKEGHSYGHPAISQDGNTLYFVSDLSEGHGTDIFLSKRIEGQWSSPENLGEFVNTTKNELFPFVQGDKLYFASAGHKGLGGLDIFEYDLSDPASEPLNLGAPVNSSLDDFGLVLREGGRHGYFSSNREGGAGADDIYELTLYRYQVQVNLLDSMTGQSLDGVLTFRHDRLGDTLQVQDSHLKMEAFRGETLWVSAAVEGMGSKELLLDSRLFDEEAKQVMVNLRFADLPDAPKYLAAYQIFNNEQLSEVVLLGENPELLTANDELPTVNKTHKIHSISFEFDQYELTSAAMHNLDTLTELLQSSPMLSVVLSGHTDSRGSLSYNEKLSRKRAEMAREYLVEQGVAGDRVKLKFHGEDQHVTQCDPCDEDHHAANRRTEIKMLMER